MSFFKFRDPALNAALDRALDEEIKDDKTRTIFEQNSQWGAHSGLKWDDLIEAKEQSNVESSTSSSSSFPKRTSAVYLRSGLLRKGSFSLFLNKLGKKKNAYWQPPDTFILEVGTDDALEEVEKEMGKPMRERQGKEAKAKKEWEEKEQETSLQIHQGQE